MLADGSGVSRIMKRIPDLDLLCILAEILVGEALGLLAVLAGALAGFCTVGARVDMMTVRLRRSGMMACCAKLCAHDGIATDGLGMRSEGVAAVVCLAARML